MPLQLLLSAAYDLTRMVGTSQISATWEPKEGTGLFVLPNGLAPVERKECAPDQRSSRSSLLLQGDILQEAALWVSAGAAQLGRLVRE